MRRPSVRASAAAAAAAAIVGWAGWALPASAAVTPATTMMHEQCSIGTGPFLSVNWNISVTLKPNSQIQSVSIGSPYLTGITAGWAVEPNSDWNAWGTSNNNTDLDVEVGTQLVYSFWGHPVTVTSPVSTECFYVF
jgi:hypothetical protein